MTKSIWKVKECIYKWLTRIGVHEGDIDIKSDSENKNKAIVKYSFKGESYVLSASKRKEYTDNLHNIECLIHSRVLGIERGIETLEQAFAGYTALPDYSGGTDYFSGCQGEEELKARFKTLAKKHHPDVGDGDVEIFKVITEQYNKKLEEL